jgi:hypothetical protein
MNTFFSHSNAVASEVHPFSVAVNCQELYSSRNIGNHYCYTVWPLNMTNGESAIPFAEIHSINEV